MIEEKGKSSDFLNAPICRFTVTSNQILPNDNLKKFPPAISVIVDPPSPSISVKSKHENDFGFQLESHFRTFSGGSMEKCT